MILVGLCMLLLIRGASESAKVNAIMVVIKLSVLAMFIVIAFTAFNADQLRRLRPVGRRRASATAAGTIFFSFIGLDAVSTAGDEVKDPQKTMPRALIAALFIVIAFYVLVAVAALGAQPWTEFEGQSGGRSREDPGDRHRDAVWAHDPRARRGDLDLLGHPGDAVRADPHPVRDGPRRHAAARSSPR